MESKSRTSLACLICLALTAATGISQITTGTVLGTVRDDTGAVVPNVELAIKNVDTGILRSTTTDGRGRYQAPNLSLGTYEVQARISGFQAAVRSGITLTVGQEAVIDFTLSVGEVTQTVEVQAEAPVIETTSSSVAGVVEGRQIRDLPLNGRSFEELAILQPGVTMARVGSKGFTGGNGQKINVAGARTYSSSFLMDGTDIKDMWGQTPASVAGVSLGVDTIREFKVLVNNFSAEYGSAAGGVVTAISRSGTNDLHGSLFAFHRNSALDARNFFDLRSNPPPFKRNQFGATGGGPIRKDKTFFFGSYEGLRERLTVTDFQNVATANAREGVLPTGQVVVHPAMLPYLRLLPLPNGRDNGDGTGELSGPIRTPTNENYFMARIDHNFSANDSFFSRYTYDNATVATPELIGLFAQSLRSRNQYLTVEETKIFTPTVLNVIRLGYNRSAGESLAYQVNELPSSLDLIPGQPFGVSGGLTGTGIPGLGNSSSIPRLNYYNLYELSDSLTLIRGPHSLKTGILIKNIRLNNTAENRRGGLYNFTSLSTALQGRPALFQGNFPGTSAVRSWRQLLTGLYIQDDFKLSTKITLNLGLRWEAVTGPMEVHGRAARLLDRLDPATTVLGQQAFFHTDKDLFASRMGFAWDLLGTGKTSIRSGFGMFHDQLLPWYYGPVIGARNPPFFKQGSISNPPFPNAYGLFDSAIVALAIHSPYATATPTALQYNFTVQQELARNLMLMAGYVGSRGTHLPAVFHAQTAYPVILPDGRRFFPEGAPNRNPNFSSDGGVTTNGDSHYNGLLLSINKRFSNGIQFQTNYTFAKNTDDSSNQFAPDAQNVGRAIQDPDNIGADMSLSAYDQRHHFLANFSWDLPFGAGKKYGTSIGGIANAIVGGWQVNSIVSLTGGNPVNVEITINRQRNGAILDTQQWRPDLVPGKDNNPVIGDPNGWIDPSSFKLQDPGFFGNLGRNTVIGPGLSSTDFSLFKSTSLAEEKTLQFRAEFFNLFNRANFGIPNRTIFNNVNGIPLGTFGRIRTTNTTSRQIQFALKFIF